MLRARLSKRSRYYKSRRLLITTTLSHHIDLDIIDDDHVTGKTHSDDVLSVDSNEDDFRFDANLRDRRTEVPEEAGSMTSELVTQELLEANPEYMLGLLETECVVAVLADMNDQLQAMKCLLPCAVQVDHADYKTLEERFSGTGSNKLIFPGESLTPNETYAMKVERVRRYLAEVVQLTEAEMKLDGTFNLLRRAVEDDARMRLDADALRSEERENAEVVHQLLAKRDKMTKVVRDKVARARVMVKTMEGEQHDAAVTTSIEKRAVRRWEAALAEQGQYTQDEEQKYYNDKLIKCRSNIDEEYRVNSEIESYLDVVKRELQESVDAWREQYDRDLEDKEQQLLQLRIIKEAQMTRYETMKETYHNREKEIQEYLMQREERRIRTELEAFLNKMATRIQAWWRGVMYRRMLGPYRKKKKGTKDKKGKKGRALNTIEKGQRKGVKV